MAAGGAGGANYDDHDDDDDADKQVVGQVTLCSHLRLATLGRLRMAKTRFASARRAGLCSCADNPQVALSTT